MKKFILSVFIVIISVLSAHASHIVGGTLSYVYNGGSSYTFTLKLFRDCTPSANVMPATALINVRGYNGLTFSTSKDFTMTLGTVVTIPSNLDSCAPPPSPVPCVQEGTYTLTVNNLPPNPGGYHCYFSLCCRNATLTNVANSGTIGFSTYTDIPGYLPFWYENFTLNNGVTVDNGPTAWTRSLGATPPVSAQVNNNLFEVIPANNSQATWTSQSINISSYPSGVNLSVNFTETGNLDANDSVLSYYSLNGGPLTAFAVNGVLTNNFTASTATSGSLVGNTIQIVIRVHHDAASPNSEVIRWDNIFVSSNGLYTNSSAAFSTSPPLFLCQGVPFVIPQAATDADGDVLVYSLVTPSRDVAPTYANNVISFTPVTWVNGFSANNPLGGANILYNALTGDLTGTPTLTGQYVVGLKVSEYRNNVLINQVIRDFQFNVVYCPTPAQSLIVPGDTINACGGLSVTFPNNSDPTATIFYWNFGNPLVSNDTSNLQYPTYTYSAVGTYTVTLIINRNTPCADTSITIIDVGFVNGSFSTNAPQCAGATVTFTGTASTSTNSVVTLYHWDFGDTQTANTLTGTTTHIYAAAGVYTAQLIVYNSLGCTDTTTINITINGAPATPTLSSNSPRCIGTTLSLTTPTVVGATYAWTGPNGFTSASQNPNILNVTALAAGTYSLVITVGGCPSTSGTTVVVITATPATPTLTSNSPRCIGTTLSFTTPTVVGATYAWTGPNGFTSALQNPSILNVTTLAGGTYSLTVTVGGCTSASGTTVVVITQTPATPTPTSNSPVCVGATISLSTTTVVGATYAWTGPNGFTSALQNPSILNSTNAAAGTYTLIVTVGGCSSGPGTTVVTLTAAPTTPTLTSNSPRCIGTTLSFTTPTVVGATYAWTGPNGFTSALQNPSILNVTALAGGTYSLVITVSGCPSTFGTTVVVITPTPATPAPTSNSPVCLGNTISLSTTTVVGATYAWTGPNGFTSALQNPSILNSTLAAAGTYSLTITVGGCASASGTTIVVVNSPPLPAVVSSNSPVCVGSTINLTSTLIVGGVYSWTGPNGFTSALQNPSILNSTLAAAGTYSLIVTVGGCSSTSATTVVTLIPAPAAPTLSSNSPRCIGTTLSFTTPTIVGATYAWTGPNGFTSALQNPSILNVTALAAGTYSLTVTVNGCSSVIGTTVVVITPTPATPLPNSNSPICLGNTLNLTSTTVVGATYAWTGPNGFTSALQNPTILNATLLAAGTYSLTITVGGCPSAIATTIVVVNPPPAPAVVSSNSPVCVGATINLTSTLIIGGVYAWTGPNAFTSALQNPSILNSTLAAAGTYSLTVTVGGCSSTSATTVVTLLPSPAAPTLTSNSPRCLGTTLSFTTPTVVGATYSWTGPNGFTSALQNPSILNVTALAAGTYSLTITVNGCPSAFGTTVVVITPTPTTPTPSSNSPICVGATLNLTTTAVVGATYAWTGPNGFTSALQNPTILNASLLASGTYTLIISVGGCSSAPGTVVVIINIPPVTPILTSNSPICANGTLNLFSSTVPGATYSWTGPNAFASALQNPSIVNATVLASGTYSVIATVAGCSSTSTTISVIVNPAPISPTIGSNSPVCVGSTILLTSTPVVGATYSWTGPNGFISAVQNPSILNSTIAASGIYSLTVTVNGCSSIVTTTTVIVNNPPTVSAGLNQTVCANNAIVTLNGVSSTGTGTWTSSGSGIFLPSNTSLNCTYTPSNADTTAGSIILTLSSTNNGGCPPTTSQVTITITNAPVVNAGPDQTVCSNIVSVSLTGIVSGGASTGLWTTSGTGIFLPSSSVLNPTYIPSSADTTAGIVTITLTSTGNGLCNAVSDVMIINLTNSPVVNVGPNISVCYNNPIALLSATSSTGSVTWVTLGTGLFNPSPNILTPIYVPSNLDLTNGFVILICNSTNNGTCGQATDTLLLTFTSSPTVSAGADDTICANNGFYLLQGTSSTGSGTWTSSGTGIFSPNTLLGTYIPSAADTAFGSVTLTLTTTNNGGCIPETDQMVLYISDAPVVNAGAGISVCSANPVAQLNGLISGGSSSGIWLTSGTGTFNPNNTTLNAIYTASAGDILSGSVQFILMSTQNGLCLSVSDTMILSIITSPVVNAGADTSVCTGSSIMLNGSVIGGSGTGIWTTVNGTGVFLPADTLLNASYYPSFADTLNSPIILVLTSTGNGGCTAVSDTILVSVILGPTVFAGTDLTTCANSGIVSLNGSFNNGGGLNWSTTGDGTFIPSTTFPNAFYSPGVLDTANGGVFIIATSTVNGTCAPVTDTMYITITPAPAVVMSPVQSICIGVTSISPVVTTYHSSLYNWASSGTGTFFPSSTILNTNYTFTTADTLAGFVWLYLTVNNNQGCLPVTDTVLVLLNSPATVFAGNDTAFCSSAGGVNLNGTNVGGSGSVIWTTSGDGTFTPSDTLLNSTYNPGINDVSSGTFILVLSAVNSCSNAIDSISFSIQSPATILSSAFDTLLCAGDSVQLSALLTNSNSLLWLSSGDGVFIPSDTAMSTYYLPGVLDLVNGSVVIYGTSSAPNVCGIATDSIIIYLQSIPTVAFTYSSDCQFASIQFIDSSSNINGPIVTWNWLFDTDTSTVQNPVYVFNSYGSHVVSLLVTTSAGCSNVDTIALNINAAPTVSTSYVIDCPVNVTFDETSLIAQGNIFSTNWSFGDSTYYFGSDPDHAYPSIGNYIYSVAVVSDSGCVTIASDTLDLIECPPVEPSMPTAFTPNGDGHNNTFYVHGGPFIQFNFKIYNEWGNIVFFTRDELEGWDGTYKGQPQPPGTYVWVIDAEKTIDTPIHLSGSVNLIR